jgi:hypothetical protein
LKLDVRVCSRVRVRVRVEVRVKVGVMHVTINLEPW